MNDQEYRKTDPGLTPTQAFLQDLWEEQMRYEFTTRDIEQTLATMIEDAYVNRIPVLTGGMGKNTLTGLP